MSLKLYKKEKLCSLTAIGLLFSPSSDGGTNYTISYPWRAVWRPRTDSEGPSRFLISVPKKRLKHAVDRVTMRRRCREAYRLNRNLLPDTGAADIAFVYVGSSLSDYRHTERAIKKILARITASLTPHTDNENSL